MCFSLWYLKYGKAERYGISFLQILRLQYNSRLLKGITFASQLTFSFNWTTKIMKTWHLLGSVRTNTFSYIWRTRFGHLCNTTVLHYNTALSHILHLSANCSFLRCWSCARHFGNIGNIVFNCASSVHGIYWSFSRYCTEARNYSIGTVFQQYM